MRIKQNPKNDDNKFDLDILNNNIDTLVKRIQGAQIWLIKFERVYWYEINLKKCGNVQLIM